MDYRDTPEEAAFRGEARTWFAANVPTGWRATTDPHARRALQKRWHQALYDAGYVGMSWPVEFGGRGVPIFGLWT